MKFFKDESKLSDKISKIKSGGSDNLFVISDYDSTLTKAYVNGKRVPCADEFFLSAEQKLKSDALYAKYRPIELNESLSSEERCNAMVEWWSVHRDFFINSGIKKSVIDDVVAKQSNIFREGVSDVFKKLYSSKIPVMILSGSIGDFIEAFLKQNKLFYDNVNVVFNKLKFNDDGLMVGYAGEIVHSLNKKGHLIKDVEAVKGRSNIVLLGDSLDDSYMCDGLDYKCVVKVGFLNNDEWSLEYLNKYDVVIAGDGSFDYVNSLFDNLLKSKHI